MLKRILTIIVLFALIITMSGGVISSALTVRAEELTYSNVLDDLQKDPTFDAAAYLDKPDDVSVQLIQIAESEDGQLFLYVYQPANDTIDLKCTSVSISVGFSSNGQGLSPQLYDLILVSTEGVFDKYLVNGFSLPDEAERYYNIVQILREFNAAVDPESDKTEYKDTVCKGYSVGQQWCAYTLNDKLVYEMNTFSTVELEIKMSSTIKVDGGAQFGNLFGYGESVESHFIVFNCEQYQIKHIYDATLHCKSRLYSQTSYVWGLWEGDRSYPNGEDYSEEYIKLSDKEPPVIVEAPGLASKEYTFNRIMTVAEFKENLQNEDVSYDEDAVSQLKDNQWVFSYSETMLEVLGEPGDLSKVYNGTEAVATILQIHFIDVSGNTYDLGVVSDTVKSTGTLGVGGGTDLEELKKDFEYILSIVMIILCAIPVIMVLIMLFPFFKSLGKLIWQGIKCGFVFVVSILTYPFRVIWYLFSGKK